MPDIFRRFYPLLARVGTEVKTHEHLPAAAYEKVSRRVIVSAPPNTSPIDSFVKVEVLHRSFFPTRLSSAKPRPTSV